MVPSDFELVTDLKKDDVKAFELIYSRYAVNLYRFVYKYLRSEEEAEELVQSVFLKIWELRKGIKTDTSFKSFLFTIAYNDMCKLFRRRKYKLEFVKETLYVSDPASNDTVDAIDFGSALKRIEKIIEKIPEKQKRVFIKSRYEGKSSKEIAAEVGLSPGTVDNYISESIKYIKSRLTNESM